MKFYAKLACLTALLLPLVGAAATPNFPRPAAHFIGSPQNYDNAAVQQRLAKFQLSIINYWPGWDSGRSATMNQLVQNIKTTNPGSRVFLYVIPNQTGTTLTDLVNKLDTMHWWLYPSGGAGSPVADSWPGNHTINTTQFTPADSNGDIYVDWAAKWANTNYLSPNPNVDGLYVDAVYWQPRDTGDWNRDGSTDSNTDPIVRQWYRQGISRYFTKLRAASSGKLFLANSADWAGASDGVPEYRNMSNGGLIEGLVGYSWSVETWGGFNQMLSWYRTNLAYAADPKLVVFHQVGQLNDYQGFRYGLAASMMDNGYYAFNVLDNSTSAGYSDTPWFDEYDAKLGQSTSTPPTSAWQSGVYRRDFENGIALVNPKGNGTVTVTLEADFKRLVGTQDPVTNNGQTVRTVTLKDRDGLVLLRANVAPKPMPPAVISIQ